MFLKPGFLFLIALLSLPLHALVQYSDEPIRLSHQEFVTTPFESALTPEQVARTPLESARWQPVSINPLLSYQQPLWLRLDFAVTRLSPETVFWYVDNPYLTEVSVFLFYRGTKLLEREVGNRVTIAERDVPHPYTAVPLPIQQTGNYSLLILAQGGQVLPITVGSWLLDEHQLVYSYMAKEYARGTAFLAAMLTYLLLIGALLIYRFEAEFAYALIFLSSAALAIALRSGLLYLAMGIEGSWWYESLLPISVSIAVAGAFLYIRQRLGWTSWRQPLHVITGLGSYGMLLSAVPTLVIGVGDTPFLNIANFLMAIAIVAVLIPATIMHGLQPSLRAHVFGFIWFAFLCAVLVRYLSGILINNINTTFWFNLTLTICAGWILLEFVLQVTREELTRRQLNVASEARIELVNRLSHELRTPLNAVIGLADLLRHKRDPKAIQNYAELIHRAGQTLLGLVNDILDFSRLSNRRMHLAQEPFRLDQVVENVMDSFLPQIIDKRIFPCLDLDPDCPLYLRGDVTRIGQVFANLVGNALKFTDNAGTITVSISHGASRDNKVQLRCRVEDNGRGIPEDKLGAVFSPYEQVLTSDATQLKGSGLGLPITKLLVEQMGGQIHVQSSPGTGSRFDFDLWLETQYPQPDLTAVFAPLKGKRMAIATVTAIQLPVARHLRHWGAEVTEYTSPIDADVSSLDALLSDAMLTLSEADENWLRDLPPTLHVGLFIADEVPWLQRWPHPRKFLIETPTPLLNSLLCIAQQFSAEPLRLPGTEDLSAMEPHHAMRILLVDDNAVNLTVTGKLLESFGVECDTAQGGLQALQQLEARPRDYSLILLDCEMPDMDGFTVCREWRRMETAKALRPLPVIALTAHALDEINRACMAAGMNEVMHKPVTRRQLQSLLTRYSRNHAE